jgi:NAD(P)-dependent dehydrogenase (short-subunit alcohol dehydrogenase family)
MTDEVVVVTGVSSGIGAAICADLAAHGYHVIGVSRTPPAVPHPEGVTAVLGDVSQAETHARAVAAAAEIGTLTGWVNNAGIIESVPLHLMTDEVMNATLSTNLYGTLAGMRAALKSFLATGTAGKIVNVSSIHGRGAFPGTPAYDASKGGIDAATRYAAAEYGHLGIRVNSVAPGAIRTEMIASAIAAAPDPAQLEHDFAALHPLRRLGESAEVARAVRFLLSEDASFVSGASLAIDGGGAARVFAFPPHEDVPMTFPNEHPKGE